MKTALVVMLTFKTSLLVVPAASDQDRCVSRCNRANDRCGEAAERQHRRCIERAERRCRAGRGWEARCEKLRRACAAAQEAAKERCDRVCTRCISACERRQRRRGRSNR
jgi:hypothetical protein